MPTKIPYVDEVWNLVGGCSKCSPGCKNCYAEKMACRLANMGQKKYQKVISTDGGIWNNNVFCDEKALDIPTHWHKYRKILVCSMGDLFHEKVRIGFIGDVHDVIKKCQQHSFYILTKRIDKAAEYYSFTRHKKDLPFPNLHLGATVCNQAEADEKIPILLQIPAAHRWVSFEPLLGEIDFWGEDGTWLHDFWQGFLMDTNNGIGSHIDFAVIGCEKINNKPGRPCKREWIKSLYDQCKAAGVDVMVKQMEIDGKVCHDPAECERRLSNGTGSRKAR